MATIELMVSNQDNVDRITTAFIGLFPKERENTGTEEEPEWQDKYSNAEHIRRKLIDYIKLQVERYERTLPKNQISINTTNLVE